MKKLIALAVAAAAMPAMAAISISGGAEVSYNDATNSSNVTTKTMGTEQVDITFSAASELDNGMTISSGITLRSSGDALNNDGGEGSITISGSFGTLAVGDVAGALDALDGATAAVPDNDMSNGTGEDAALSYTLPEMVSGLTVMASFAPKDGGDTGVAADTTSVAAKYSAAGFSVFVGQDSEPTSDESGYGFAYTMNGLSVGYTASEDDNNTGSDTERSGFQAGYTTGNLTLAVNTSEVETGGVVTNDLTSYGLSYSLGGGASVYASTKDDDKTTEENTTVGLKFSF